MATRASIQQAAIVRLGSEAPQSVSVDSDEMTAVDRIYGPMVEEMLCAHAWPFATRDAVSLVTNETPPLPWYYTFPVPAESIGIREVLREGIPARYEIREDRILAITNEDLTVIYNWNASEERWPGDFAAAVEQELLARLLEAFDEKEAATDAMRVADYKMRKAARRNRRQMPGKRFQNPRLLRSWYGRNAGRV